MTKPSRKEPTLSETIPLLESHAQNEKTSAEKERSELSFVKTLQFCGPFIIPRTTRLRILGVFSVTCTIFHKAFLLLPGLSLKTAVDGLSRETVQERRTQALLGAAGYFLGRVFAALMGQGQDISLEYCVQRMTRQFATDSFAHLQRLSLSYHMQRKTGEITSILGRGAGSISTLMRLVVFFLGPTILEAMVVSFIFFSLGSPLIALITACTVLFYIWFTGFITKFRVRIGRALREAENKVNGRATEVIMNFATVKSFGMEQSEIQRYDSLRETVQGMAVKSKGINCAYYMGQNFIVQIGTFFGLGVAAYQAAIGRITPGDFVLVQAYIGQLFGPLLWMGTSYGQVVEALTNIEQVMELFATIPEVDDAEHAIDIQEETESCGGKLGAITFDCVTFKYAKEEERSGGVRNLSFHVPAGKMIALVGPSGAGKSTIGRLLLRLYDVDEGQVLVNGYDVRDLTQRSLRQAIGVVAQDTILFNDTLRNNISYGRPDASDAEVWEAVRLASLEEFVKSQPLGLDTITGEQGIKLSGGERQRVGIARAVLKKPDIMILDESTSALSTIDEQKIQQNLRSACKGRTTLAIAHRLSTVMMADEILVINDGVVVERGRHDELVNNENLYSEMWKLQAGKEAIEENKTDST